MAHLRCHIAIMKAANAVDRVHHVVRPMYQLARPLLHHRGIDTSIPDKAMSTYDGIRRALSK